VQRLTQKQRQQLQQLHFHQQRTAAAAAAAGLPSYPLRCRVQRLTQKQR
jgi:hypothetical protein